MSGPEAADLIYESQFDPQNSRACGAACLRMVYRAFGKDISQDQIWHAVAKQNLFGSLASTTHLMAKNALSQGFAAAVVQARFPLQALKACHDAGIHAILNHRLDRDTGAGHYSVLVDIGREKVILHDPLYGPSRSLSHAELLELWQPSAAGSEIAGYVLIGIAAEPQAIEACQLCKTPFVPAVDCPNCKQPVSLQPAALFGCLGTCPFRMWSHLYCPSCDFSWTFKAPAPQGSDMSAPNGAGQPAAANPADAKGPHPVEGDSWGLTALFAAVDKFSAMVLKSPAMTSRADVKQYLGVISAQKEKLYLAQAEQLAKGKAIQEKLAAVKEAAKQREEARLNKTEKPKASSPPLDPDALRVALLKNLGWTK